MNLDDLTIELATTVVTAACGGIYLVDSFLRRPNLAGRHWALMYVAAILASIAYSIWYTRSEVSWFGLAIGNGAVAAVPWYLWCGARAYNGRSRAFAWIPPVIALVVAAAVLVAGPDGGYWAGTNALYLAIAAGCGLAAVETQRGGLGANPTARGLSIVLVVAAGYSLLRALLYLVLGPEHPFFDRWFGTAAASLGFIVVGIVATVTIVQLQGERIERSIGARADRRVLTTEVLDEGSFEVLARDQLDRGAHHRVQLVLVDIDLDDRESLLQAYGRASVEVFLAEATASLRRSAPPGAVIGHGSNPGEFRMLLPSPSIEPVVERARSIQAGLRELDEPGEVGVTLTASIGLVGTDAAGYDFDELVAAARGAVAEARSEGGDDVVVGARRG